jgi:hypothetical protein
MASPCLEFPRESIVAASEMPSWDDGETSSGAYSLDVSFLFADLVSISFVFVVFFSPDAIWPM